MPRVCAVDVGSNTVHALVADLDGDRMVEVAHHVELPELGAEVARTGRIGTRRMAAALRALESVMHAARAAGCEHVVAGATAAVRRAGDGPRLLERASEVCGVPMRLISEEREAELSFLGVADVHAGRHEWLMADLGGGSTEVVAAAGDAITAAASLPIGSGTYAARFLSDPPLPAERERLRAAALAEMRRLPDSDAERLVVTGGTAIVLPSVLSRQSPPSLLTTQALLAAEARLDAAPIDEVSAATGIDRRRVAALRGGVEILLLLMDWYGVNSVHVTRQGLRHGMLRAWSAAGESWWRPGAAVFRTPT